MQLDKQGNPNLKERIQTRKNPTPKKSHHTTIILRKVTHILTVYNNDRIHVIRQPTYYRYSGLQKHVCKSTMPQDIYLIFFLDFFSDLFIHTHILISPYSKKNINSMLEKKTSIILSS